MKKIIILVIVAITLLGCKEYERALKDTQSKFFGLNREVQVYSLNGTLIKTYAGRIDIKTNANGKVLFELDGKRYIIINTPVIIEEK